MAAERYQILLVEDSPSDARLIRELLADAKRARFDVVTVERLSSGIDTLSSSPYDAVLLDLSLPDSQGIDTCVEILACRPSTPIVVLSGLEDEELALNAVHSGAQDYLVKADIDTNLLERSLLYAIERKRTDVALRKSVTRFRRLVNSNIVGIILANLEGLISEANDAFLTMTGYQRDALPLDGQDLTPPEWRDDDKRAIAQLLAEGIATPWEKEYIRKEGGCIPVLVGMVLLEQSTGECICLVVDLTEQKRAEERLKAEEELLRKLLDLQERERQLFAYEIHDGFVQYAVGAHMGLEAVRAALATTDRDAADKLAGPARLLSEAIKEGRRLVGELRPLIIDEQGILAAIEYLIGEQTAHGALDIAFAHDVQFARLPPLLEGTMFRIVQEALNNVRRHSGAERAAVRLTQSGNRVRIEIEDAGSGFDLDNVPDQRFGLRGIRERARLFDGKATIESAPGRGTRILVELPLATTTSCDTTPSEDQWKSSSSRTP
jgi:two-component system sensor histidine kinase UhpB